MSHFLDITISPNFIDDEAYIHTRIKEKLPNAGAGYRIVRKSIDARRKQPHYVLRVIPAPQPDEMPSEYTFQYEPVREYPRVIIVGAGPAGYFAALRLIENGIKPIIFEQGEAVQARGKRIARILRNGELNTDSNYCFGEGGAGAFSDGKLYTRASKRGDVGKILHTLVFHGAPPDILINAQPHIGSNKLPPVIRAIRNTITACGGKIHFNAGVTDFLLENNTMKGVELRDGTHFKADAVILAVGNSARRIYHTLHERNILIEAKPIAIGVRVEHPQTLIDTAQYHHTPRHPKLPAATYRLTGQCGGHGVYSFCMCPGGHIVPTATTPGELAVNGMSYSTRRGAFANAGIVTTLDQSDLEGFHDQGALSVMAFQQALEKKAFLMGGGAGQKAPAQRMTDFLSHKTSIDLPHTSYLPGLTAAPVHELLPPAVVRRLQEAFRIFDGKLRGFVTREALLVAVESRTSAPVRIPRRSDTFMHPHIERLFPCGEGAGYAGGIVSSAMDGEQVATKVAQTLNQINKKGSAS